MEGQNEYEQEQNDYEQEQIQQILLKESEKQKIIMDRELREFQEREYIESLEKDMKSESELEFDEPSPEEMRRIRLIRFENYKLIKD
jgi:hypothetical protein